MGHWLRALVRLVVQLVLFAATGRWFSFEQPPKAPPQVPRPKRAQALRTRPRPEPRASQRRQQALSIEPLGGELVLIGGERAAALALQKPRRGRPRAPMPSTAHDEVLPAPRSLAAAMRDPRALRDAVILASALGRRTVRR